MTDEREEALRPCPFCGGQAYRVGHRVIACGVCGIRTDFMATAEAAVSRWNGRQGAPPGGAVGLICGSDNKGQFFGQLNPAFTMPKEKFRIYASPPAQATLEQMIKALEESVASKDREIDRLLQLLSEKQAAPHHPSLEELRKSYQQAAPSGPRET